jgi:aminopeptidase YwaD
MKKISILFFLLFASGFILWGQEPGSSALFQKDIKVLASEEYAGRLTGSEGERLSAEYIAKRFEEAGLAPAGDSGTWFQKFSFIKYRISQLEKPFTITNSKDFEAIDLTPYTDYYPLSASADTVSSVAAKIVAIEYGLHTKDINNYAGKDVKNKWVLIKIGLPEVIDQHSEDAEWAHIHKKVKEAVNQGAKGVIICNTEAKEEKPSGKLNARGYKSSIPVVYIDTTYEFLLNYDHASASYNIAVILGEGMNVVGQSKPKKKKAMVIGAHYDHLGNGELGGSRKEELLPAIHYGADDNASGTSMVMALSQKLKGWKFRKFNYVFVAFSGEELGLLGSKHFVDNPPLAQDKIKAMLNFDMVGRLDTLKPQLDVYGTGTSPSWELIVNKINRDSNILKIRQIPTGTGPSDHTNFYYKKIPALAFFTGLHDHYHTPFDKDSLINYEGMELVFDYVIDLIRQSGKRKHSSFEFTPTPEPEKKTMGPMKVKLGIMPDYGHQGKGVMVSGVSPGGVAEKGGIQSGDQLIKIGEHELADIYAYMNVLGKFNKGDKAKVVLIREGVEMETEIVF